MKFEAHYLDGKKEVLLSVPNYRFYWQGPFYLKEPKLLLAGTEIVVSGAWDNSALNPENPDPSKTVHIGGRSNDEVWRAYFSFFYAD